MSIEQCNLEVTKMHPGIEASNDGYVPVAMGLIGSGDYYYINREDLKVGALYRIDHDAIEDGKVLKSGIDKLLQ